MRPTDNQLDMPEPTLVPTIAEPEMVGPQVRRMMIMDADLEQYGSKQLEQPSSDDGA